MSRTDVVISRMTLDQKIGQMFTFGFQGTTLTPEVIRTIKDLHAGGLRLTPHVKSKDFSKYKRAVTSQGKSQDLLPPVSPGCRAVDLQRLYNTLQDVAKERDFDIPLHMSVDLEGGGNSDLARGGYPIFPSVMGITNAGDPKLFYKIARVLGRLMRATGANMIHSPVLDVVEHDSSPEIGYRSYHKEPERVAQLAAESLRGFLDAGVIATGKHFPGRGYSHTDVHYEKDDCKRSLDEMMRGELLPYGRLIERGLPAIMLAHSSYSGMTGDETPATVSRAIIQKILRETLGFQGVVTTDSITMQGILDLFPVEEACARAILAGADLVLYKTIDPASAQEAIALVKKWVADGTIPEEQINASVARIIRMKEKAGLFTDALKQTPDVLERYLADEETRRLCEQVARDASFLSRNKKHTIPLPGDRRILVVEQEMFFVSAVNDISFHPFMLWENLAGKYGNTGLYRVGLQGAESDIEAIVRMARDYDVVVATSFYSNGAPPNTKFLEKLIAALDKEVVVVTNSPFPAVITKAMNTVVCLFSEAPASLQACAEILAGDYTPKSEFLIRY